MQIGGLQKLTLIDYPEKLACIVFLIGCNFRCHFCHNFELVLPEKIKNHPKITEKYFFDFLKLRQKVLKGVCITGGEPTIHQNLPEFIKKIKNLGFLVKLDTNGTNPEMLKNLIEKKLIDYVAMDIKTSLNNQKYAKIIGVNFDLKKIKKSIKIIRTSGIDYEFRTTIIPKLHTKEEIINIAKYLKGARVYYLQQFNPKKTLNIEFQKQKPFKQEELQSILKSCNQFLLTKTRNYL